MSILARISSTVALTAIVLLLPTHTQAWMSQSQEQSVSQSSSSEFKCDSNCQGSSTFKTENTVWQAQSQSIGRGNRNTLWSTRNSFWDNQSTTGEVHLTWDQRGGTCQIRYTEFGSRSYKYSTSTACDNGGITIGGLQTRKSYKFQVRKDDEAWSPVVVRRAR